MNPGPIRRISRYNREERPTAVDVELTNHWLEDPAEVRGWQKYENAQKVMGDKLMDLEVKANRAARMNRN